MHHDFLSRIIFRKFSTSPIRTNVRVRFAPSPTGFLHLGSIRTALYNFLFTKKHAGQFILRIEDTDQSRTVGGAIEAVEKELHWVGLIPDEGPSAGGPFGPYLQSQRRQLYQEKANQLLKSGHAYRCFCSPAQINLIREEATRNGQIARYDNRCRYLTDNEVASRLEAGTSFTIRFKLPSHPITFNDIVTGEETIDLSRVEADPIILKSDGFPTYHLANVVDDGMMKISHVFRGIEWQVSTPKHLALFEALECKAPTYGHLPLILAADGTKLSKRLSDIRMDSIRNSGVYPEAVTNYLARMGNSIDVPENDSKIYSITELTGLFEHERLSSRCDRHDVQVLKDINRNCLKKFLSQDREALREELKIIVKQKMGSDFVFDEDRLNFLLNWCPERVSMLPDLLSDEFSFLWGKPLLNLDTKQFGKDISSPATILQKTITYLQNSGNDISGLKQYCDKNGLKYGALMSFLRTCLTGKSHGPPISEIFELLGEYNFYEYLNHALNHISTKCDSKSVPVK